MCYSCWFLFKVTCIWGFWRGIYLRLFSFNTCMTNRFQVVVFVVTTHWRQKLSTTSLVLLTRIKWDNKWSRMLIALPIWPLHISCATFMGKCGTWTSWFQLSDSSIIYKCVGDPFYTFSPANFLVCKPLCGGFADEDLQTFAVMHFGLIINLHSVHLQQSSMGFCHHCSVSPPPLWWRWSRWSKDHLHHIKTHTPPVSIKPLVTRILLHMQSNVFLNLDRD